MKVGKGQRSRGAISALCRSKSRRGAPAELVKFKTKLLKSEEQSFRGPCRETPPSSQCLRPLHLRIEKLTRIKTADISNLRHEALLAQQDCLDEEKQSGELKGLLESSLQLLLLLLPLFVLFALAK